MKMITSPALSKETLEHPVYRSTMSRASVFPRRTISLLFVFFWVIPRRLIYICRRFGLLYPIFKGL